MAPYDEIAVEKALRLRDAGGGGSVTVVSVGPQEAGKELRTALAMGADKAVHVVTPTGAGDASATATALADAMRGSKFDLLLCGKQATDEDDAAVGPMLAALLDLPFVAFATSIDVAGTTATVRREIDGEVEVLEVDLPAVLTAQKGLAEPRLPGLKGIMAAKKKPLEEKALAAGTRRRPPRSAAGESRSAASAAPAARRSTGDAREAWRGSWKALRNDRGGL